MKFHGKIYILDDDEWIWIAVILWHLSKMIFLLQHELLNACKICLFNLNVCCNYLTCFQVKSEDFWGVFLQTEVFGVLDKQRKRWGSKSPLPPPPRTPLDQVNILRIVVMRMEKIICLSIVFEEGGNTLYCVRWNLKQISTVDETEQFETKRNISKNNYSICRSVKIIISTRIFLFWNEPFFIEVHWAMSVKEIQKGVNSVSWLDTNEL